MSEAPERIWADMDGCWWDKPYGESPEYVRCDMLQEIFARYSRVEADRIEELEADNARLETEAKLQAEEIDKTRRRADKWQSMVLDCGEYLKPGETPAERIEREINDCLALMKLLEKKQMRIQELEAENKRLKALVADVIYSTGDDPEIMAASRAEWAARALAAEAKLSESEALLAKAVDALGEAIYLLDPDEEDIAKETGLHRIVTTYAELTGGKDE